MIEVNDLTFYYKKHAPVFQDLFLSLKPGAICGLLGKNGAGKTTLLKLLSGLLFPKTGQINALKNQPKHRRPAFLNQLYFLPESPYLPDISMKEYINTYACFYPKFDPLLHLKYCDSFDIMQPNNLSALSYGQKKKFLIAFGLATHAKIILLDEPTNGLDIPSKNQFRTMLSENKDPERFIIISTHQVHDVQHLLDPIVILEHGKIILNKTPTEILEKLAFSQALHKPNPKDCLYAEKRALGYAVVNENHDKKKSPIDIELLFNAIQQKKDAILCLFKEDSV